YTPFGSDARPMTLYDVWSRQGRLFPVSPSSAPMLADELPLRCVNEPAITIRGNPSRRIARTWPSTDGDQGRIAPDVVFTAAMFGRAVPSTVPKPPPMKSELPLEASANTSPLADPL